MDAAWLQIVEAKSRGYRPLVDFGPWRVAALGFEEGLLPERIHTMERHNATDEVFVLLAGRAVLLLGGPAARPAGVHPVVMDSGTVYNVRRGTWHGVMLNAEASLLLVENRDTGSSNTEIADLPPVCCQEIRDFARLGLLGWGVRETGLQRKPGFPE